VLSENSKASAHICIDAKQSLATHIPHMLSLSLYQETLKVTQSLEATELVYPKDNFLAEM